MTIMKEMRTYIQPQCEIVSMLPFMADDIGVNNLSGDNWTFTNNGVFDEEEEPETDNNSVIWQ